MKNISDIAKLAGVSKSTVSRFLNNGSVSPKTKDKLSRIIAEHDYQPNQFAQSLRAKHTNIIGAIIPRMNSHAVDETVKGIVSVCQQHNYQLLLNYTGLDINAEIAALETFSRSKVDGIILMATTLTAQHLEVIQKIDVPVILVGQSHDSMHSIVHDDYQAGYLVGEMIGQQHLQNLCFFGVTEDDIAVGIERKQGLIEALKQYNIHPQVFETSFKYEEAKRDVAELLQTMPKLDAIIGATDSIALAIHNYCVRTDYAKQMPSIYGFGGDPMTQLVSPEIITVKFNYFEAGTQAMKQLHDLIFSEKEASKTLISVEL
ncbi:sucrose operon repressor [Staphylococcus petrasii]|uniref:LacI family transcriptional regulator n=1 Tax=Staphylococcus petrasii TaxID=1276936 RepID=A0A380FY27_9STAP|nr:LacI family DNA-binding transcriptional regulator [Staphylococcus petrasii]PNZ33407.1 LacI family transcriptional regulator [Staphylococcus petrasii]TGE11161.1 LacI family transcriptional regulator [Staphylococcus petrasii]TGE15504.1 LacI family transcriptional regulator [Staphylococcus petrasii]SUM43635.1 sucrose operon repressor [Staphylococcus petrasii]